MKEIDMKMYGLRSQSIETEAVFTTTKMNHE